MNAAKPVMKRVVPPGNSVGIDGRRKPIPVLSEAHIVGILGVRMPWNVDTQEDPKRLVLTLSGRVTPLDLRLAVQECIRRVLTDEIWLVLADCRELEGGHSIFDLHALADFLHTTGLAHRIREAVLVPEQGQFQEVVRFWETTCFNRGIQVRLFSNWDAAIGWLNSFTSPVAEAPSKLS